MLRGRCPAGVFGSRGSRPGTVRVEAGSISEHRAGDVEQAVGYRTQGAGVPVAAGAQGAVLAVARRIPLGSHPSPVECSLTQPVMGGETARHDQAPAGAAGDWRHAAEAAQRGVVSSLQHVTRLGQQRGQDARADARQRQQDGRVRPARWPPWLGLLGGVRIVCGSGRREPAHQAVELTTRMNRLLVDQNEAFDDELHMGDCSLGGTRRDLDGLRSQLPAQRGSIDSADAVPSPTVEPGLSRELVERRAASAGTAKGRVPRAPPGRRRQRRGTAGSSARAAPASGSRGASAPASGPR